MTHDPQDNDFREVNLQAKKTEAGWYMAVSRFFLRATPRLFEWFSWVLILGALSYLSESTESLAVEILLFAGWMFFIFYFLYYINQYTWRGLGFVYTYKGFKRIEDWRLDRVISLGLTIILWHFLRVEIRHVLDKKTSPEPKNHLFCFI